MENVIILTPKKCTRSYEFKQAVKYLLANFPPKPPRLPLKLEISFLKKNCTDRGRIGDYFGVERLGFFETTIRIAYGIDGKSKEAIPSLFHEYKHLLQDTNDYLSTPNTNINYCIEAEAWAVEQFPIYLTWLANETETRRNIGRSRRDRENGIEYLTFIMKNEVYTLTKEEAAHVLAQLSVKLH